MANTERGAAFLDARIAKSAPGRFPIDLKMEDKSNKAYTPIRVKEAKPVGPSTSDLNKGADTHTSPDPLPTLPSVSLFDYSFLPDALRDYVRDISERMQCPPDFAAVGVMVMMSRITGRKIGIRPMRNNDWTVIPNLWGAVVGNSGVIKAPP